MPGTLDLRQNQTPAPATTTMPDPSPAPKPPQTISWETLEYHPQQKGTLWYAALGVAMAGLLFVAFLMRSLLTGVVFSLFGLLVLLYSERPPRTVRFEIARDAVLINERRYPFPDLDAFNIVDSPLGKLLLIRSRRLVMPLLHFPLADQDQDLARRAVRRGVKEDPELREPLADLLAHWLGF